MSKPFKTILAVSFARGYATLLSLATLFVSARYLGPEGRGTFAAAIAWAALFATIFNLSLGQALQYRLQSSSSTLSLAGQIGTLGGLALIAALTAVVTAFLCFVVTDGLLFKGLSPLILSLAFAAVPLLIWEQFSSNILSAASRLDIYSRAQYIGRTFALVIFVLLVAGLGFGVTGALVAQVMGPIVMAGVVALPLYRLVNGKLNWVRSEVKPLLTAGAKVHITTVSAFMLDQISILLINNYLTKAEVGHFQLAQQMVSLLLVIPQAALMVIYGGMAKSDPNIFWPEQRRILFSVMMVMVVVSVLAYILAPFVILNVAGHKFQPTVGIFRALLPSVLGLGLATMMTPQWIGRGLFLINNTLTLISAALVVAASWIFIPIYGLDGAIWVRLIVYIGLVTLIQLIFGCWCSLQSAKVKKLNSHNKRK